MSSDELERRIWGAALTESERSIIEREIAEHAGTSIARWLRFLLKVHDAREGWFEHAVASWKEEERDWQDRSMLTVEEAAALLKIGRSAAYEAVKSGEIPSIRINGRSIRVPRSKLMEML